MREKHQLGSYACAHTLTRLESLEFGPLERKPVLKIRALENWSRKKGSEEGGEWPDSGIQRHAAVI